MACKAAIVDLGNKILKIVNGIRLPWFPVLILYVTCTLFWLVLYSSFVNITDFALSILRYFIFIDLKLLSSFSCSSGQGISFCWTLYTDPPLFGNLWPFHCLCVDLHMHFSICWTLSLEVPCTSIFTVNSLSIPILPRTVIFVLVPV